jgi:hypothetical protein
VIPPYGKFPDPIKPDGSQIGINTFPDGVVIAPKKNYKFTEPTGFILFDPRWPEFSENKGKRAGFYLIGYMRYRDIFGARYILGYCAVFDIYSDRFVLMGGEGLNYARTEHAALI